MLKYVGEGEGGGPARRKEWDRLLRYKKEAVVDVVSEESAEGSEGSSEGEDSEGKGSSPDKGMPLVP